MSNCSLMPIFFFYRNDNIEKSIDNYREAFDVVYLVSLQSDATKQWFKLITIFLPCTRDIYKYLILCRMVHPCGELLISYLSCAHLINELEDPLHLPTLTCLCSLQICSAGDLLTQDKPEAETTSKMTIMYSKSFLGS